MYGTNLKDLDAVALKNFDKEVIDLGKSDNTNAEFVP